MHEKPEKNKQMPDLEAPKSLIEDLSVLHTPPVNVPGAVDDLIVAAAWRQFSEHRRRRAVLRWVVPGVAAAAAMVLVLLTVQPRGLFRSDAWHPEDFNRSGSIDILDAFAMARGLKEGLAMDERWDLNNDGLVDQKDIDRLALRAVSLRGSTSHVAG